VRPRPGPSRGPAPSFLLISEGRGFVGRIEGTYLPADTAGMAKKPAEPPKPATWTIYRIAAKQERPGTVEALDEQAAIEKGAAEFGVPAKRLMAIR
jgi:hypothetical protein